MVKSDQIWPNYGRINIENQHPITNAPYKHSIDTRDAFPIVTHDYHRSVVKLFLFTVFAPMTVLMASQHFPALYAWFTLTTIGV
jgi:hypothetical protein